MYFSGVGLWCSFLLVIARLDSKCNRHTFQLDLLSSEEDFAYVKYPRNISVPLQNMTLCFWAKSRTELSRTVFSYATHTNDNAIKAWIRPENQGYIGLRRTLTGLIDTEAQESLKIDEWMHICFVWSSTTGFVTGYLNGMIMNYTRRESNVELVPTDGIFIIGQDQDILGGGFQVSESWNGSITELHLWDSELNPDQVSSMANCTFLPEGNVLSWGESDMEFYGDIHISDIPLPCKHCD